MILRKCETTHEGRNLKAKMPFSRLIEIFYGLGLDRKGPKLFGSLFMKQTVKEGGVYDSELTTDKKYVTFKRHRCFSGFFPAEIPGLSSS